MWDLVKFSWKVCYCARYNVVQKTCLKPAILDFPGKNLQRTSSSTWTSSAMTACSWHAYPSCQRETSLQLGTNLKMLVFNVNFIRIADLKRLSLQKKEYNIEENLTNKDNPFNLLYIFQNLVAW